jgi:hypothetical protein
MLDLKRGPQDPILPIRATKHPRTTALYGDSPTASQSEGLLSHWISSLVTLTHKAASGIFTERLSSRAFSFFSFAELSLALRVPPQRSSSSQLQRTDVLVQSSSLPAQLSSLHSTHLPRRKSPKLRTKRPSPRSSSAGLRDPPTITSAPTERVQSTPPSPSSHTQPDKATRSSISVNTLATDSPQLATGPIAVALPIPSGPPSTPTPGPSKSVSRALSVARPFSSFRPSIPGAFLSPSIETPTTKPPYIPHTPQTEPRVEAIFNPYYRSMAPPPSPNLPSLPTPRPQPPDSFESQPSSTAASTSASTSTLPTSREVVDAAVAVAEKKLSGRVVKRVFSRKGARQHIFQSAVSPRLPIMTAYLYCANPA